MDHDGLGLSEHDIYEQLREECLNRVATHLAQQKRIQSAIVEDGEIPTVDVIVLSEKGQDPRKYSVAASSWYRRDRSFNLRVSVSENFYEDLLWWAEKEVEKLNKNKEDPTLFLECPFGYRGSGLPRRIMTGDLNEQKVYAGLLHVYRAEENTIKAIGSPRR